MEKELLMSLDRLVTDFHLYREELGSVVIYYIPIDESVDILCRFADTLDRMKRLVRDLRKDTDCHYLGRLKQVLEDWKTLHIRIIALFNNAYPCSLEKQEYLLRRLGKLIDRFEVLLDLSSS
jgi:hypothetical protein